MTIKIFITLGLMCVISSASIGQSITEAVRYSVSDYASTARSIAVGGAFSSLGADISAVSSNPAGLGEYKYGEYVLSVGTSILSNTANLRGELSSSSAASFNLGVLGFVSTNRHRSSSAITYSSFVISLNKFLDFGESFEYSATTSGSIAERFTERANGLSPGDLGSFEAGPAFDAGVIFDFDRDNLYETDFNNFQVPVLKTQTVDRQGSGLELAFGYGANINNKVSVGVSIGIPFFSFEENKVYREIDESNSIDFFENLEYTEFLETSGAGFNAKLGVIIKPTKKLRVSLAGHSPSFMFLNDNFNTNLSYTFNDTGSPQTSIGSSGTFPPFQYGITTPWRAISGAAYMFSIGQLRQRRNEDDAKFAARKRKQLRGFISGEVEFLSYSHASFNLTSNSNNPLDQILENDLNNQIDSDLGSAVIVKLGAELAQNKLRYRAGIRYEPSAFKAVSDPNITFSGGLGYRMGRIFLDLAGSFNLAEQVYSPYFLINDANNQRVNLEQQRINIDFTLGYKL